jgi:transcriptional regulator with XRE-family HTH domain
VNLESSSPVVVNNDGDINAKKCERVKACIDSYLLKNSNLSLVNVEEKTSVPHSTLRRYMNGSGNPSAEAAIKIFRSLGYDNELVSYMKDYHPEIATIMAMKSSHNQEFTFISETERDFFVNEDYFTITTLAYTTNGTTEQEIAEEFGRSGLVRLNELLDKGIVKKVNNRYVGNIERYKLSFSDTKRRIELAMRHYKLSEAGNINNWMSLQTESINEAGLKALKSLHQENYNKIKELIFNNPMYSGNVKVYSATVSSTILSYKDPGELQ